MKTITETVLGMTAMTDAEFTHAVACFIKADEDVAVWFERRREMAIAFEVAELTVTRWANGKARPHPLLQSQIVLWIEERE